MTKYHVNSKLGCVHSEVEQAFFFAVANAEASSFDSHRIVFIIHSNQNDGWFSEIGPLKAISTKTLFTGFKEKYLDKTLSIIVKSISAYTPKKEDIVIYTSLYEKDAFKVDEKIFDAGIEVTSIAIPILTEELDNWKEVWHASTFDLTKNTSYTNTYQSIDCITTKALDQMDSISYKGNTNSSDEEKIKTIVRTLYKYYPDINTNTVASYLTLEKKWNPIRAIYVKELFEKSKAGKPFKGGEKTGHPKRYKAWKDAC